ncbi:MAG: hypothetical protein M3Y86_10375 [Verrucomicrobiota bacterium]|nr:hypothetical protein [Verrucomicrobiota bacterium]
MTLAGADGETRAEMSRVLHVETATDVDAEFGALQKALEMSAAARPSRLFCRSRIGSSRKLATICGPLSSPR